MIKCGILKFRQCLRNNQRHQAVVVAECIAAQAHHTERNLKFGLIRHILQRIAADDRVRVHGLQALSEILALRADFCGKDSLLRGRRKFRRNDRKKRIRGIFLVFRVGVLVVGHIDFHRPVENCGELLGKALRHGQVGQSRTARQRQIADRLDRIRNAERHERIAVAEQICRDFLQRIRQTDLLILARCSKGERSKIADRIRENEPVRPEAAGKCIHIDNLQTLRQHDVYDRFEAGECARADSAQRLRQRDRFQHMLGFLCPEVQRLRKVRRQNGIALRDLEDMVLNGQCFRLLRRQDFIVILHELRDRRNSGAGKNALFRPVQLDFGAEQEIFDCLSVREALAEIDVGQVRAAGECVGLDLLKRFRKLQCKQTRAVPERLRFNSADSFRNLKALAAL